MGVKVFTIEYFEASAKVTQVITENIHCIK